MMPHTTVSKTKVRTTFTRLLLITSTFISLVLVGLTVYKTIGLYHKYEFGKTPFSNSKAATESINRQKNTATQITKQKSTESDITEIVVFISLTISILTLWLIFIFVKTYRDAQYVEKNDEILKKQIDERKRAELALHQTHTQLQTKNNQLNEIIEGTSDQIAAIDNNFNLLFFNNSYQDSFNSIFNIDISIGSNIFDFLPTDYEHSEKIKGLWQRALNGEKFEAEQTFLIDYDKQVYFELNFSPIFDDEGKVVGATQIARDVTLRKLATDKIENERNFVSAVVNASSSLVIVLNRDGRIIKFNKACEEITGYSFEDVQGKIVWEILSPTEEIRTLKQSFRNIDKETFNGDFTYHWITKEEKIKLISWKVSSIKDESNHIQYVVATGIDITEKEEFEKARNRMLDILENSDDFIGMTNITGKFNYLNSTGRKMLGLNSGTNISNIRLTNCLTEESSKLITTVGIPQAIKNGSWIGEAILLKPNGSLIPVSQLILAHRNKHGNIEYLSTVARDISEFKKMENELQEARDIALETARMKSEFLASMSHEIRTPMNGVIGMAELLSNTELDEEQQDFVETIHTSGEALLTIINDILDFSKIEAGKLKFEKIEFSLRKTIESVIKLFSNQLVSNKIELLMNVYQDVPDKLYGDPGRLKQILTNLIGNAIKFTEEGEVVIRVRQIEENDGKLELKFSVWDTGIGISEEAQANLFNAFSQADKSITRKYGGTGLGLAISKKLANLMDGKIGVNSELHEGSEFWFTAQFDVIEDSKIVKSNYTLPDNSKILIVSNNDTARNILTYQAKSIGVIAEEASNIDNALKILNKASKNGEAFQYVIIDRYIGRKNGLSLALQVNNLPSLRKTSIVLMLNKNDVEAQQIAKDSDINEFLYKPIQQTVYTKKIVSLLNKSKGNEKPQVKSVQVSETNKMNTTSHETEYKARILIAEDNLVNQKVISNQVLRLGYDVDVVSNGKEALQALESGVYDLILMDCQMPVMDGLEATAKIRENEALNSSHIPIIAVTAHAIVGDKEKCLSIGMDDYISKPTNQERLKELIQKWLKPDENADDSLTTQEVLDDIDLSDLSEKEKVSIRLAELAEVCDADIVIECIDLFIKDTSEVIEKLNIAQENADYGAILSEAHKLKGSASNMGADRMPKICQKLMALVKEDKFEATPILINQISVEYKFLKKVYKKEKNNYQSMNTGIVMA